MGYLRILATRVKIYRKWSRINTIETKKEALKRIKVYAIWKKQKEEEANEVRLQEIQKKRG